MAIVLDVDSEWLRGLDVPMKRVRCDDEGIYSAGRNIMKRISEDAEFENIINILMNVSSDKLEAVKEKLQNMEEIVS